MRVLETVAITFLVNYDKHEDGITSRGFGNAVNFS